MPDTHGQIPSTIFPSVKAVSSPDAESERPDVGPPQYPPQPVPMALAGLVQQATGLGPPSNVHDRVVFVSNVGREVV